MIRFVIFALVFAVVGTVIIMLAYNHLRNRIKVNAAKAAKIAELDDDAADRTVSDINAAQTTADVKAAAKAKATAKTRHVGGRVNRYDIRTETFQKYLRLTGWTFTKYFDERFIKVTKDHGMDGVTTLLVPIDESLSDYGSRMQDTVRSIAEREDKNFVELASYLRDVNLRSVNPSSFKDLKTIAGS